MKTKTNNQEETDNNDKMLLLTDFLYHVGDFTILFDEDSNKLKINTSHGSKHLKIRPKADNSIEVSACR